VTFLCPLVAIKWSCHSDTNRNSLVLCIRRAAVFRNIVTVDIVALCDCTLDGVGARVEVDVLDVESRDKLGLEEELAFVRALVKLDGIFTNSSALGSI
jgi:hypothetical protein